MIQTVIIKRQNWRNLVGRLRRVAGELVNCSNLAVDDDQDVYMQFETASVETLETELRAVPVAYRLSGGFRDNYSARDRNIRQELAVKWRLDYDAYGNRVNNV